MATFTDEFSKHYGDGKGYSYEEALHKKEAVDDAHGVWKNDAKWAPSCIVPDERGGYKVIISSKE